MALTVKDILELPCGQKMTLLAGEGGLARPVVTVEIADYEFDPDVEYDTSAEMEPNGFIITSFLFAKDDSALILESVKQMYEIGMACVAFKKIIYEDLPPEVMAFADEKGFPVLSMEKDLWFEKITFEIMYAVQFDVKVYLSEEKIESMLSGSMSRSELGIILKGISLKLQPFVTVVYIPGSNLDADRLLRSFYLLKGFHSKGLMIRYGNSLFLIITSQRSDFKSHDLIRQEAMELLGMGPDLLMGMSDVHEAASLDQAFRESWQCCIASAAERKPFDRFGQIGMYRVLLPALENSETVAFAKALLDPLEESADLRETAHAYVDAGGDIVKTAAAIHVHQNTVRYRLGRIRERTGLAGETDGELFMQLKIAVALERANAASYKNDHRKIRKEEDLH